jgi:hypothetical protein
LTETPPVKRATAGFVISIIAAILILLNALLVGVALTMLDIFMAMMPFPIATGMIVVWATAGIIFGIIVLVGAIMIYRPGREMVGGILVIIFSILSIIIGGGFIIGLILGIIGGALGLAKK